MSKTKPTFKIKKLEKLPPKRFPEKAKEYDELIAEIRKKEAGIYEIEMEGKNPKTLYSAFAKRLKDDKELKLHSRKGKVILERF
jgi:predicted transcriptional regulator